MPDPKDRDEDTVEDENDETKEDAQDESDEADDEPADDSQEGEGADDAADDAAEGDDKPLTAKSLKSILKPMADQLAVLQRHSKKNSQGKHIKQDDNAPAIDGIKKQLGSLELMERKRTFGYENSLAPDEVDVIFKLVPNPSKKTLQDPFIQGGLEKLRSKKRVDANLPAGHGARKFGTEGKSWDKLSPEEKQRNFPALQKSILARKRGN